MFVGVVTNPRQVSRTLHQDRKNLRTYVRTYTIKTAWGIILLRACCILRPSCYNIDQIQHQHFVFLLQHTVPVDINLCGFAWLGAEHAQEACRATLQFTAI